MSRTADLTHTQTEIQKIENDIQESLKSWQTYFAEVFATVRGILEDAGVWDDVHNMEREREDVRLKVEQKITALRQQQADLIKVRDFLAAREAAGSPPASSKPVVNPEPMLDEPEAVPEKPESENAEGNVLALPALPKRLPRPVPPSF